MIQVCLRDHITGTSKREGSPTPFLLLLPVGTTRSLHLDRVYCIQKPCVSLYAMRGCGKAVEKINRFSSELHCNVQSSNKIYGGNFAHFIYDMTLRWLVKYPNGNVDPGDPLDFITLGEHTLLPGVGANTPNNNGHTLNIR